MSGESLQVGNSSFFRTWLQALTKPQEITYRALAAAPQAKASRAYLWVFLCSFAPALASVLVSGGQLTRGLAEAGVDAEQYGGAFGAALVNLLCFTPLAAVIGTVGFVISVALMQWIARMFGGTGTFDKMAYVLGAITAPSLLVSALLTLPSGIPLVGLCFAGLSALFGIYIVVLEVISIKAVQGFGLGQAIGTLIIPGLAIALVCCCALAIVASVAGLAVGDIWSTINQSLIQ